MTKKLKVAVYCRVPARQAKDLLDEQENILLGFSDDNNMEVVDVIKEVADGRDFKSDGIQALLNKVIHHRIDAIVYYDKTRIAIYDDLYIEFELICQKHEVFLIPLRPLILEKISKI